MDKPDYVGSASSKAELEYYMGMQAQLKAAQLLAAVKEAIDGIEEDELVMGFVFHLVVGKPQGELTQEQLAAAGIEARGGQSFDSRQVVAVWGQEPIVAQMMAAIVDESAKHLSPLTVFELLKKRGAV